MTATMLSQKEVNQKITAFLDLIKQGTEAWIKAGEILVELVDSDPHSYDYIMQRNPHIDARVLSNFEKMGRRTLHPQLLMSSSPGFGKLKSLPMSLQERYIDEPIPLIVHTEDGTDVMLVQAKNMTKEQARQVFATERIRTEGEQKAWLMQQRSNAAKPVVSRPWSIKGNRIIINGVEFTRKEIAGMLAQMD